ncbi:MAG: saccharopine dehydrogenase NADP-binding domain-containing protein, partial [Pseudomonadota bacterium]
MNDNNREFDVIVWGATGFTGRLVAGYLLSRYGADGELRWALGGRSEDKLVRIRDELGERGAALPLVTGDSHDAQSMDALAARTRVVCTTVGPYAKYGSELVGACVHAGTHYTDLCGEPQWMRQMIDQHQDAAVASGARIVHACGFDSIPSDMGVYFLQREAHERTGGYLGEVRLGVKAMRGGASGGTVASLMNAVEEGRKDRTIARVLVHPYSLNPDGERDGPDQRDQQTVVYDGNFDAWTAPFVMAGINTKVVRRGHALRGYPYGRGF